MFRKLSEFSKQVAQTLRIQFNLINIFSYKTDLLINKNNIDFDRTINSQFSTLKMKYKSSFFLAKAPKIISHSFFQADPPKIKDLNSNFQQTKSCINKVDFMSDSNYPLQIDSLQKIDWKTNSIEILESDSKQLKFKPLQSIRQHIFSFVKTISAFKNMRLLNPTGRKYDLTLKGICHNNIALFRDLYEKHYPENLKKWNSHEKIELLKYVIDKTHLKRNNFKILRYYKSIFVNDINKLKLQNEFLYIKRMFRKSKCDIKEDLILIKEKGEKSVRIIRKQL